MPAPAHVLSVHFVGTPDYLSPELLRDLRHGAATDWWALGVLAYELLTGAPPFTAPDQDQVLKNILSYTGQGLLWGGAGAGGGGAGGGSGGAVSVSAECRALVEALLVPDPTQRLGAKLDSAELKAHAWFRGVQWHHHQRTEPVPHHTHHPSSAT